MTGGFLSVPIMRPNHCWTILHVSILAMLLLTLNADSEDSKCEVEIRVRRNTVYEAFLGDDLRINCTVLFCNNSPPATYWYKLEKTNVNVNVSGSSHIKTEWKTLNHVEGISYLIFQNILTNDSGVYRCRSGHSVSHSINISVDGEDSKCEVEITVRRNTVYEAFLGDDLGIHCTVLFCNNSPPTISWYKLEKTNVPVNVSGSSHIKTEWKTLNHVEGISYLIFQNILTSDSGVYYCRSGHSVSHSINVSVDGEDSKCEVEIRVRRNTVYEAFLGDDLRINCTVLFCNNSPPTISWYKLEKTNVNVNVSGSSHIKTEWKTLNHVEGISYLIFQNILTSDSGVYYCQSGHSVGHSINVSVDGDFELTTVTWTTSEPESSTIQHTVWLYRVVGIMVFVIIVIIICVASKSGCKGVCCAGESRNTPDPSCQPSHDAWSTIHIYENDH
ncbi:leucine-rich repeats and immunoglobulin-like domains protein 1 isoform X2 [Siniperca chuatsi]|uniref:leucine-rich repeats and immunoglobulin-like domains protein 1 isoform X2 n=1 Tax=Siniperca chuatsi TaxID=119488 RepID=UPI001CE0D1E4|nr:leucine-rich repeats and immunoglobulin-like domains protein 1 isoform X2 [Siniperca chuatsi]